MSIDLHRARFVDYTPPAITAICFSHRSPVRQGGGARREQPTSLRCAVGRANGDIEIWNPRDGWSLDVTLKGGEGRTIEGLAWATQPGHAPRLFSVGSSTQVTEWALDSLQPLKSVDCNAGAIWSLAISPDGDALAVGCEDGSLVMLDIAGGPGVLEYRHMLTRQKSRILSLAFGKDDVVFGGCSDSTIKAWNYKQARGPIVARMTVDRVAGEQTLVWAVLVLEDGSIVSGDSTGAVKVWSSKFYSLQQNFKMHDADVLCLGAGAAGDTFFSAGVDQRLQMYKLVDGRRRWAHISGRRYHQHDVRAMATYESESTSLIVTGGVDMSLALIPLDRFMQVPHNTIAPVPHGKRVSVAAAADPRLLLSWSDRQIKIWSLRSADGAAVAAASSGEAEPQAQLVARMKLTNEENLTHAAIRQDGRYIVACSLSETKLFALRSTPGSDALRPAKVSTDVFDGGALEASFTSSGSLCLLRPDSSVALYTIEEAADGVEVRLRCEVAHEVEKPSRKLQSYAHNVRHAVVSADEKQLAVCDHRGQVSVYELRHGKRVSQMPALPSAVTAMNWRSADRPGTADRYLVVCTADMRLHEFDGKTGRLTAWSRANTARIPFSLTGRKDAPHGVHVDRRSRCWMWGAGWIAYISLAADLPDPNARSLAGIREAEARRKRRRSTAGADTVAQAELPALTNGHAVSTDDDDDADSVMELDLPDGHASAAVGGGHTNEANGGDATTATAVANGEDSTRNFWITTTYRPILHFGPLADDTNEWLVVERPLLELLAEPHIPPPFYRKKYGRA